MQDFLERIAKLLGGSIPPAAAKPSPPAPEAGPTQALAEAVAAEHVAAEHVAELLRLGRIGHVRGIEAKLAQIEAEGEAPSAFVARMRGLVASYDLRRYVRDLERLCRDA